MDNFNYGYSSVLDEVAAERKKQIDLGYDAEHDDKEHGGTTELNVAAAAYHSETYVPGFGHNIWPFSAESFHPGSERENLIKTAALIVARIEQIDRGS